MSKSALSLIIFAVLQVCTEGLLPTTTASDCKCGVPQVNRNRIVGGQPAKKNQYPWLVAIFDLGEHICGGTLLSSRTVLSAAHCVT